MSSHILDGRCRNSVFDYLEGYKCASDELIENAINSDDIKTLDTLIFPIKKADSIKRKER